MNPKKQPKTRTETIEEIARKVMLIETLETRNMDGLDFHEVAVWQVQQALEMAFVAGRKSRNRKGA
jgi:hypothetical protein